MAAHTILITGGAGYIGSHIAYEFYQKGYDIIILDALLHQQQWPHSWATLYPHDYADQTILEDIFTRYAIAAVIHCAAFIEVGKSVTEPLTFYNNNVAKTITLLNTMRKHHIKHVIFSSSCAVYGIPHIVPITEDHSKLPISPYGWSKLMAEQILTDMRHANLINFVALRYFNAAGSTFELGLCEQHIPETHVIPLLCDAAYHNTPFYIFGTDHDTPDGSCIRDFLHVRDIAQAHVQAFEYLLSGNASASFNLGTGNGISVLELVDAVQRVTGHNIHIIYAQKRPGDPARLVADTTQANNILSWQPQYSDLDTIVHSAWQGYLLSYNKHQIPIMQKQKKL